MTPSQYGWARVLVVDDNVATCRLLERMLGMMGITVRSEDGAAQIQSVVTEFEPHVILLDVHLEGGDGFEILEALGEAGALRDRSVLMATGDTAPAVERRARELGARGVLSKPFDRTELAANIVTLLAADGQEERTAELQSRGDRTQDELYRRSQELQAVNEQLRTANDARNEFVARMSHEVRTPLNSILGFAELLGLGDLSEEQRQWVDTILGAGRQLHALLDDVLDISRIESGALSLSLDAVALDDLVADTIDLIRPFAHSNRVDLYGPPTPEQPRYVRADHQRLRQVLVNLLSNAVKYNRPDGIAAVRVGPAGDGRVRIEVTDTGPGLAPSDIRRLFTSFERLGAAQSDVEGTGLGLALSRRLTEAMGGTIGVTSYLGAGSTFWIQLPETQPAAITETGRREARRIEVRRNGRPRRVLYVEDMASNILLIEEVLKRRPDVTLIPAMLGATGLELAREHRVDLALLDLQLPDMSGLEVMRRLHEDPLTHHTPVVIVSADATKRQKDTLIEAGASAYLTKPFCVARFLEILDHYMVGARPAAEDPGRR